MFHVVKGCWKGDDNYPEVLGKKIHLNKLNKVPLGIWIQVTEIRKTWNFTGSKEDMNRPQYGRNQGS